ncbi:MAG: ATP-binding protein, partial [Limisphaerales bacterium]
NNVAQLAEGDPKNGPVDQHGELLSVDRYPPSIALHSGSSVENFVIGIYNPDLKEQRWVSVDAGPLFDGNQADPIAAYSIFVDITERINAEQELRQSKMHLALAQSIASIGSAAVDFRTGKWDWSEETFRIYGVNRNTFEPTAETLGAMVHPEDWPLLYSHYLGAQKGINPDPIEYRIKRPDGAERILRRIATLVRDKNGVVTGIVGTVQDITELRDALQAKLALESQLYHAQKLDALGVLAGGIAHDLNNTLVPVVALSQTILDELQPDDPIRPLLDLIREGGERARDLVAHVLAFTRQDTIENTLINVRILLEHSLKLLRAAIPSSVEIVADLAQTPHVQGNRSQLHQIILNLLSNAAQAIGDRSGTIFLSTRVVKKEGEDRPEDFICIKVSDTGCGMSEEIKARIFEPFFTTKRVGTGTGLGLSVVHGIVTAHGGWINVTSIPGQGSSFEVLLPIVT